jgi:hypothetical protein
MLFISLNDAFAVFRAFHCALFSKYNNFIAYKDLECRVLQVKYHYTRSTITTLTW